MWAKGKGYLTGRGGVDLRYLIDKTLLVPRGGEENELE
jgi:hypothetical protein